MLPCMKVGMVQGLIISGYKYMGVSEKCEPPGSAHQGGLKEMKCPVWAWHTVGTHLGSSVSPPLPKEHYIK